MKKLLFSALALTFLLASCQDELTTKSPLEGEQMATFSVSLLPQSTRATIDNDGNAAKVNRCVLEVYQNDKVYRHVETTVDPATLTATFQLPLVISQKYDFLFWADCATLDNATQQFTDLYYNTANLKEVKIIDETTGNLDAKDAFFYCEHQYEFTGKATKDFVLHRPLAQVNIVTNDLLEVKNSVSAELAQELWPATISVNYTTEFPMQFNVFDGTVSDVKVVNRKAEAVYGCEQAAAYNTLNMDYIFVAASEDPEDPEEHLTFGITKADITLSNGSVITILENTDNYPIKRNYRTNIIGSFLTDPMDFVVVVDPIWYEPDYNPLPAPPSDAEPQGCEVSEPDEEGNVKAEATEGSTIIVVPQGVTEFDVNPGSDGGKYNMDVESVTLPASLKETDLTFCKNIADITYNCDADHDLIIHTTSFYGTGENNSPRGFTINFVGLPKSFQVEGSSFDYKIGDTNFGRCWFNTGWDSNSKVIVNLPAGWKEAGFNYPYFTGGTVIYEDGVLVFSNVADTPMP